MKKSSLVGHVIELLDLIRPMKQPADNVVSEFFRKRHYLGSKDRRFISETLYSILRNYRFAKVFAEGGMRNIGVSEVPSLVLYSAFALKVQNETVESVLDDIGNSWKIAFPNDECRTSLEHVARTDLPEEISSDATKRIAITYSFPDSIVAEWLERNGETETALLCKSLNEPAPIVVRVNTLRTTVEECRARLKQEGIDSTPTRLSPYGLVLAKRINTQAMQSFKDGWYEMQDEGSQLLSLLLEPNAGEIVVDACAGGGGKSVHIAALMMNGGELFAIDVDEKRLRNIEPRVSRSGATNVTLLHAQKERNAVESLMRKADAVLVDAPCSGVGTFRRNPAAKLGFDGAFVERISKTQRTVLEHYSSLVKSGGRLVYSTCTLLRKENEDVVESFLQSHPEFSLVSASGILRRQNIPVEPSNYLTLLPHKSGTDGFFAAVMQRASS